MFSAADVSATRRRLMGGGGAVSTIVAIKVRSP
jgi:hypothetical protein